MITNKDKYYFNKAKNASELSDFGKIKIGCIAVYKKCILSVGYNSRKSSTIQMKYDKFRKLESIKGVSAPHSIHAEIMCINQIKYADIDFSKVKLYIYREDLNGNKAMCKPCSACSKFISDLGIKKIYYTTYNGYVYEERDS